MKILKVDRTDNQYIFCSDEDGKMYALDPKEVPSGTRVKDTLLIDEEGNIKIQKA